MLDLFESDQPNDYIGGFPDNPHRRFETVTYMLAGRMRHKDNTGNEGVISADGVPWMCSYQQELALNTHYQWLTMLLFLSSLEVSR